VRLVEEVEEDQAPMLGSIRVSRGGSWSLGPQYARVARRRHFAPGYRYDFLGVRLVEEVDEEQTPASGSRRGILGSTWYSPPQFARAAARGYDGTPGARGNGLGVRLVEEVEEDQTPASGSNRVLRGSSWGLGPRFARVARRDGIAPGRRYDILGVRLVEEVTDA
jgi:formylglycine-generating enzyme required for sulfatase activity